MQFWKEGLLRNTFNEKRTLERVDYVFWKDKNLGSTYGGGYVMGKIYDLGKENDREEIKLPILFDGNESKKIAFLFTVDIQDEEDMKNKFFYICTGVFCHWETDLELSFKDTRDNMFNENGKLLSQEVEDSWWLFPNNKEFEEKIFAKLDIFKDIVVWKIVRYLHLTK